MNHLPNDNRAEVFLQSELQKLENKKLRLQKFKMFFAGLTFATLSFIGTHPVQTEIFILKIFELFSLVFLLLSGIILLVRLSEIKLNDANHEKIPCKVIKLFYEYLYKKESIYWIFFILGMTLMTLNRSISMF